MESADRSACRRGQAPWHGQAGGDSVIDKAGSISCDPLREYASFRVRCRPFEHRRIRRFRQSNFTGVGEVQSRIAAGHPVHDVFVEVLVDQERDQGVGRQRTPSELFVRNVGQTLRCLDFASNCFSFFFTSPKVLVEWGGISQVTADDRVHVGQLPPFSKDGLRYLRRLTPLESIQDEVREGSRLFSEQGSRLEGRFP